MVSATKVRQNLGHVMNEVALKSDEYIVERAGKPLVAVITPGVLSLTPLAADEEDTKYLVCALEGNADYIISGDRHLKDLKSFRGVRIVDPAGFIEMMEK